MGNFIRSYRASFPNGAIPIVSYNIQQSVTIHTPTRAQSSISLSPSQWTSLPSPIILCFISIFLFSLLAPPTHRHSSSRHPTFTSSPTRRAGRFLRSLLRFVLPPQRRQGLSIPLQRVFPFIIGFLGVDFEEMIKDNQEHGQTTEEDGERVEVVVGYHVLKGVGGFWVDRRKRRGIWIGDLEMALDNWVGCSKRLRWMATYLCIRT